MVENIRIALAQIQSVSGNFDLNLKKFDEYCAQAHDEEADIVVFPELATTGYLIHDAVFNLAEPIPEGKTIKRLAELARRYDIMIATGMPEKAQEGVLYNTAVLIGPNGYIGKCRKILLPNHSIFNEKRYFRPATTIESVSTDLCKFGMIICYDIFSPEIVRYHAYDGAEVVLCLSASPGVRQGFFEAFTQSRSMENSIFVVYVNQCGIQEDLIFWGGSEVRSPSGNLLIKLKYDEEDFGVAKLDLKADTTRVRPFVPTLRDQPNWLYENLKLANETL